MAFASGSSLFGAKPAGTGLFGSTNTATQPSGGLFGQSQNQSQQPSTGLFGQPQQQQQQNQPSTGTGLFGQPQQQQQNTGGGLFGSTTTQPQQQQGATGGLFGQANANQQQNQPATGGGLLGNTNTGANQGTTGGLFGNTSTNQGTTGGLFGNTNTNQGTTGGLFGSTNTANQGTTTGGLFGNANANTNQGTTGGLFGNTNTQNQGNTGGGLFATANANQGTNTGGLFGNTNANQGTGGLFGSTNASQGGTGGLFGNAGANQGTTGGLFGSTNANQGTQPNAGGLFGSTQGTQGTSSFGAFSMNKQPSQAPGLGASTNPQAGNMPAIQKTTKFNDLPENLRNLMESIDTHIQGRVQISKELRQRKLGEEPTKGQTSIKQMHKELIDITSAIRNDSHATQDLKARVDQSVEDTVVAIRIIDAFRNPQSGSTYLKDHASFPLEYFTRIADQMKERLLWYKTTIEQIERKLSSSSVQSQTPQGIVAALQAQHATFLALASKTAALDAEAQKIKTLYTQKWRSRTGSMRDPFSDTPKSDTPDFGMSTLTVR